MRLILQPFLTIAFWSRRRTSRELIPPWCEHPTVSWCSLALKSLMLGKWWQNCKDAQNSSIAELDMRIWKDTLDADDWWLMIDDCWLLIGDWWLVVMMMMIIITIAIVSFLPLSVNERSSYSTDTQLEAPQTTIMSSIKMLIAVQTHPKPLS